MRADTQTITIDASLSKVFRSVSNPENLPHWARAFCQAIRPDGDAWLVSSPQGEVRVRYRTDEALGVIDFHLSPAPGMEGACAETDVQLSTAIARRGVRTVRMKGLGNDDELYARQVEPQL